MCAQLRVVVASVLLFSSYYKWCPIKCLKTDAFLKILEIVRDMLIELLLCFCGLNIIVYIVAIYIFYLVLESKQSHNYFHTQTMRLHQSCRRGTICADSSITSVAQRTNSSSSPFQADRRINNGHFLQNTYTTMLLCKFSVSCWQHCLSCFTVSIICPQWFKHNQGQFYVLDRLLNHRLQSNSHLF